jgi:hypothetical protein
MINVAISFVGLLLKTLNTKGPGSTIMGKIAIDAILSNPALARNKDLTNQFAIGAAAS